MTSGRIRTRMYVMHQSKALMPSTNTSQGRKFSKKYRWFIIALPCTVANLQFLRLGHLAPAIFDILLLSGEFQHLQWKNYINTQHPQY